MVFIIVPPPSWYDKDLHCFALNQRDSSSLWTENVSTHLSQLEDHGASAKLEELLF